MGALTLNDVSVALAFVVGLGGSVVALVRAIRKILQTLFQEQTVQINQRLDKQEQSIQKIDEENCKNFLVQILSSAERGDSLTEMEKIRLSEQFEHYTAGGGNSYIKDWKAKLKEAGKL